MYVNRIPSMRSRVRLSLPNGAPTFPQEHHVETELLIDELRSMKIHKFNMDGSSEYSHQTTSLQSIRRLCTELRKLKEDTLEEMSQSVFANYRAYIQISRELSGVGEEIVTMQGLLSKQATVVHSLVESVLSESFNSDDGNTERVYHNDHFATFQENILILHMIDSLLIEGRLEEALDIVLKIEGDLFVQNDGEYADDFSLMQLQELVSERKQKLADHFKQIARQSTTCGSKLRTAISALCRLDESAQAHSLLLATYSQKLSHNIQELRSSGIYFNELYVSSISRLVFSALSQAAKDSGLIFGNQSGCMSELLLWASKEVENLGLLIVKYIGSCFTRSGSLHVAAISVSTALVYCSLLEAQGLSLRHALLKRMKEEIEKLLQENVKIILESVIPLAATDDWRVYHLSGPTGPYASGILAEMKLSSSAWKFHTLIQNLVDDLLQMSEMQLEESFLKYCADLFESYIEVLLKALPAPGMDTDVENVIVQLAETEYQQLGILANVYALQEELLPRAVLKISKSQQRKLTEDVKKQWRLRLREASDRIKDHFCRKQVLELLFTDDEAKFTPNTYIEVICDDTDDAMELMPSPVFQDLFFKLQKLKSVAADVLPGRDRVTSLLLIRLVKAFTIFIQNDEDFWKIIDQGISKDGCQQLMLDIYFIHEMVSDGPLNLKSKQIQRTAIDMIEKAIKVDDQDLASLQEEGWFRSTAQACLSNLMPKGMKNI